MQAKPSGGMSFVPGTYDVCAHSSLCACENTVGTSAETSNKHTCRADSASARLLGTAIIKESPSPPFSDFPQITPSLSSLSLSLFHSHPSYPKANMKFSLKSVAIAALATAAVAAPVEKRDAASDRLISCFIG